MTFRKIVFYIVVIVLLVVVGYSIAHKTPAEAPIIPVGTAPIVTSMANFACDGGSSIAASFSDQSVALKLSDGRSLALPQILAADGAQYQLGSILFINKGDQAFLKEGDNTTYNNCINGSQGTTVDGRKVFSDNGKLFTFTYPQSFILSGGGIGYTEDWKTNVDDKTLGLVLATVTTPENYQPKTNFGDAKFHVGTSSDPKAIKNCFIDNSGIGVIKASTTVNGIKYTKFISTDAGAGNRYQTTSYRTMQDGQCFALEYTVHYAALENFDPSSGIKGFDQTKVQTDFDSIIQSFTFLPQSN